MSLPPPNEPWNPPLPPTPDAAEWPEPGDMDEAPTATFVDSSTAPTAVMPPPPLPAPPPVPGAPSWPAPAAAPVPMPAPPAPTFGAPVRHAPPGGFGGFGVPGGQAPPPQAPGPARRRTKRRTILWTSVGVGVALLAGGAAVAVSLINDSRDPAAQVEEYLDLLASGEAQKAAKLVDPAVADASLLTDEVLGAADERIDVVSVETLDRSGDRARVLARMSLAGEEFEREFTVDHGLNEWLLLETWELNEPLVVEATISLTGPVSAGDMPVAVQVAGVETVIADTMTGDDTGTVYVYPGVYGVAAGDLGAYLTSEGDSLVAGHPDTSPEVRLTAELNGAFEEEVLAQAAAYADGCVRVGGNEVVSSNMDSSCPAITRNTRLSELKVSKYPKALSDVGAKSFRTDEYEFEVRSSSATARLDRSSSSLSGEISWKDGKPSVVDASFGWW